MVPSARLLAVLQLLRALLTRYRDLYLAQERSHEEGA
jgi:hypothetical protein